MKTLSLGKVAGLLMSAGLVLGLLGPGVGASFIWNGQVSQPITVGSGTLHVWACLLTDVAGYPGDPGAGCGDPSWVFGSSNPPAGWGPACTVEHVTTSSGHIACAVTVVAKGEIYPTHWVVTPSITGTLSEPHLWTITNTITEAMYGPGPGPSFNLDALGSFNPEGFSNDPGYYVDGHPGYGGTAYTISWNNLTNASFGDAFTINLSVVAQ
jgi:hypothetical protein